MSTTTTTPAPGGAGDASRFGTLMVRDRADVHRQYRLIGVFAFLLVLVGWMYTAVDSFQMQYSLAERITREDQPVAIDAQPLMIGAMVLIAVALLAAVLNKVPRGGLGLLVFLLVALAFFAAFIIWSFTDQDGFQRTFFNPMPESIRTATPIILGALAGVMCERAGVINIAIEGQFILGAFFASVGASLAYSAEMGLVGGVLAGVAMAAMLGVFAMRYHVNQVVLGVVLVAFASGLAAFLLSQVPNDDDLEKYFNLPPILERLAIPVLSDIPILGFTFFDQNLLVYLMYVCVALSWFLLYQTKWGLRVRSVGEHPKAADTVGIKVNRVRWQAVLLGGVFAGLGGAYYTVGSSGSFDNDVTAGNGFIALAAVIMGRWHPIGATFAALFFGFMLTLGVQLDEVSHLPPELIRASPYLATVIAVAGFVGRVRPPAADGEPYVKS